MQHAKSYEVALFGGYKKNFRRMNFWKLGIQVFLVSWPPPPRPPFDLTLGNRHDVVREYLHGSSSKRRCWPVFWTGGFVWTVHPYCSGWWTCCLLFFILSLISVREMPLKSWVGNPNSWGNNTKYIMDAENTYEKLNNMCKLLRRWQFTPHSHWNLSSMRSRSSPYQNLGGGVKKTVNWTLWYTMPESLGFSPVRGVTIGVTIPPGMKSGGRVSSWA